MQGPRVGEGAQIISEDFQEMGSGPAETAFAYRAQNSCHNLALGAGDEYPAEEQLKLGFETAGSWLNSSDQPPYTTGLDQHKLHFETAGSWS